MADDDLREAQRLLVGERLPAAERLLAKEVSRLGGGDGLDLLVEQEVDRIDVRQAPLVDELDRERPVGLLEERRRLDEQGLGPLAIAHRRMGQEPEAIEAGGPVRPVVGDTRRVAPVSVPGLESAPHLRLERAQDRRRIGAPFRLADVELSETAVAVPLEIGAKPRPGLPGLACREPRTRLVG